MCGLTCCSLSQAKDFTTTVTHYDYYLNTIAEKSLCYGPGLLNDGEAGKENRFIIQGRNNLGENRTSGADKFVISVMQDGEELYDESTCFHDFDNGRYEVTYTAKAGGGDITVRVNLIDENDKEQPIRGSPFTATCCETAKPRANEYAGPLVVGFITKSVKELEEFFKATDAGINIKLNAGDVKSLIKVKNYIKTMYEEEERLILKQDEVLESLGVSWDTIPR